MTAAQNMINEQPSRTRFKVLALCMALAAVTYLDRICISITAKDIMRDLNLTQVQMSYVFSAFTLAYGAFEIPTGHWGDRIGTRAVLTRIVCWWSAFTVLTAAAFNFVSLVILRFLFGAGEAGAWPNAARTFSRWFPANERGTVQGIFFMGAHLAGGLTPLLVTWTLTILPWRGVFIVFGLIGFVWAAVWMWWFRNDPSEHKDVNAAELAYIERGRPAAAASHESLRDILRLLPNRNMAALCLMYFTQTYGFYFIITWLPTYLENVYGVSSMRLGLLAGLPLLFSVAADLLGGISTDRAVGRWGLRWGRASVGIFAFTGASAVLFAGTQAPNVLWAAVLIGVAGAFSNFPLGAAWGAAVDIGGARSGAVSAAMNTAGQVGGMLSPIIAGYSVQNYGSWALPLYIQASLYGVGALCWFFIDAGKPLAPATPSSHS